MSEIKPCPFCGSKFVILQNDYSVINQIRMVYMACVNCKSYGPDKPTKEAALQAWNQRPYDYDMPAIVKKVKELETKNKELQKELDYLREWTSLLEGME